MVRTLLPQKWKVALPLQLSVILPVETANSLHGPLLCELGPGYQPAGHWVMKPCYFITNSSGSLVLPSTLLTLPSLKCESSQRIYCLNPANVYTANIYTASSTRPFSTPTCELGKENSSHISYCTLYWVGVISSITNILLGQRVPRKEET